MSAPDPLERAEPLEALGLSSGGGGIRAAISLAIFAICVDDMAFISFVTKKRVETALKWHESALQGQTKSVCMAYRPAAPLLPPSLPSNHSHQRPRPMQSKSLARYRIGGSRIEGYASIYGNNSIRCSRSLARAPMSV